MKRIVLTLLALVLAAGVSQLAFGFGQGAQIDRGAGLLGLEARALAMSPGMMGYGSDIYLKDPRIPIDKAAKLAQLEARTEDLMRTKVNAIAELPARILKSIHAYPVDKQATRRTWDELTQATEDLFKIRQAASKEAQSILGEALWAKVHPMPSQGAADYVGHFAEDFSGGRGQGIWYDRGAGVFGLGFRFPVMTHRMMGFGTEIHAKDPRVPADRRRQLQDLEARLQEAMAQKADEIAGLRFQMATHVAAYPTDWNVCKEIWASMLEANKELFEIRLGAVAGVQSLFGEALWVAMHPGPSDWTVKYAPDPANWGY